MLKGVDVSSYQGNIDFDILKKSQDFIIPKASEGTSFKDPKVDRNQSEARRVAMLLGYYHFARPDLGNLPEDEAQWFINCIWPAKAGEILVLDYEVNYRDPVGWSKRFLDYLAKKLNGTKALIYLNQYLIQSFDWSPVANAGYGLWVASYDNNPNDISFDLKAWKFAAMKQYSSSGVVAGIGGRVDANSFYGDAAAFKKYGYKDAVVVNPFKAKCDTLKIATDRLNKELTSDLSNPSANYEAIYTGTLAKARKIADTGTL